MTIADELAKLDDLRTRGVLSQEEFERAKARLLEGGPQPAPAMDAINSLRRSITDSWIGGVCGGIARACCSCSAAPACCSTSCCGSSCRASEARSSKPCAARCRRH